MAPALSLVRPGAFALITQALGMGAAFALQLLLARVLTPNDFGTYAVVLGWAVIDGVLAGVGMPVVVLRFAAQHEVVGKESDGVAVRWVARIVTLVAGVVVSALSLVIIAVLDLEPSVERVGILGVWLVPLLALSLVLSAEARVEAKPVLALAPSLVVRPASTALAILGVWWLTGGLGATTAMAATLGCSALVTLATMKGLPLQFLSQRVRLTLRREWIVAAGPLWILALSEVLLRRVDLLIVGATVGLEEAAVYEVALRIASAVGVPLIAANVIAAPRFARLYAANRTRDLQRVAHEAAVFSFVPAVLATVGLFVGGGWVLGLFGTVYEEAWLPLVILATGQLAAVGCGAVVNLLNVTGRELVTLKSLSATAVLNVCALMVAVPRWGIVGAACVSAIALAVWSLWMIRAVRRELGISPTVWGWPMLVIRNQ